MATKNLNEDCEMAENTLTYREITSNMFHMFNVMKEEKANLVKRIKKVILYGGKILGKTTGPKQEVVGGLAVVYELTNGEDLIDGLYNLPCTEQASADLELKENEYITSIYGNGTEFIKSIIIETNFYRKIKVGSKGQDTSSGGIARNESSSSLGAIGDISSGNIGGKKGKQGDKFEIQLPAGAKVLAIGGTGDTYLRSLFAYYKI